MLINKKRFLSSCWRTIILVLGVLKLGEWITNRLDDARITAEAKYSVNITKSKTKICLSLHYNNRANSFLYANGVKIQHVTTKGSEIKPYPLCLGNTLTDFTVSNMKKKKQ